LYTAQKSNSHYAPQPYTQTKVSSIKSLLNSTSEISLSRNATGREFQRHGPGPATEKLLSPRRVCVLIVAYVKTTVTTVIKLRQLCDMMDLPLTAFAAWQVDISHTGAVRALKVKRSSKMALGIILPQANATDHRPHVFLKQPLP